MNESFIFLFDGNEKEKGMGDFYTLSLNFAFDKCHNGLFSVRKFHHNYRTKN